MTDAWVISGRYNTWDGPVTVTEWVTVLAAYDDGVYAVDCIPDTPGGVEVPGPFPLTRVPFEEFVLGDFVVVASPRSYVDQLQSRYGRDLLWFDDEFRAADVCGILNGGGPFFDVAELAQSQDDPAPRLMAVPAGKRVILL